MADHHLGRFIYFYFLFMAESNHVAVCHMVIVWEGSHPTSTMDICQNIKH